MSNATWYQFSDSYIFPLKYCSEEIEDYPPSGGSPHKLYKNFSPCLMQEVTSTLVKPVWLGEAGE